MERLEILLGADPEVFMLKDAVFHSAHGAIKGDKKNPFKVNKGAVQVDGMALEFNIDPAKNADEFVQNLTTVMAILKEMVPGYDLAAVPVAEFDEAYIAAQPAEALELGCEPDYNAWNNGAANPRPNAKVNFRTGAGHVHIGWTNDADINDPDHMSACIALAKQLDYYLGIPSLIWDDGVKRRTLYGAPGAFRPKPYGMEYRVLSNAWLRSEDLMRWVFNTTNKAVQDLFQGNGAFNNEALNYFDIKEELMKEFPDHVVIADVIGTLGIDTPPVYRYDFYRNNFLEAV